MAVSTFTFAVFYLNLQPRYK